MRTMVLDVSIPKIAFTRLLGRLWKGAYFAPTSPLRLLNLPEPPLPAQDWVRVRNEMCGICGSDLHQIFLDAGLDVAPVALPSNQRIYLGHEMVGRIIEIGSEVSGLQVGDRVVRWGRAEDCRARGRSELCPACVQGHRVLCQFASEPREHQPIGGWIWRLVHHSGQHLASRPRYASETSKPFSSNPPQLPSTPLGAGIPEAGEQVLVVGCGTIGFLLIQAIRALQTECEITAVAQFPWQAELALDYGAQQVFLAGDDGYDQVASLTAAKLYEGRSGNRMLLGGFDLVFDVVGVASTLNNALRWTRAGGTVVLVGVNLHRMHLDVTPIWYQEVDLVGAVGHDVVDWQGKSISTFELAMDWMRNGSLQVEELLTHTFPLDAYRQAFSTALDKRDARSIKVAFEM